MSNAGVILGYIMEALPNYQLNDREFFHRANDAAIAAVQARDEKWPPFARPMLSVTGPDSQTGSWAGRRIIVVAAHINGLYEHGLPEWLDKLEAFLCTVYWLKAEVTLGLDWYGTLTASYRVKRETVLGYNSVDPKRPDEWELRCQAQPDFLLDKVVRRAGFTTEPLYP